MGIIMKQITNHKFAIARLADFIFNVFPEAVSKKEDAVDISIKLMSEYKSGRKYGQIQD